MAGVKRCLVFTSGGDLHVPVMRNVPSGNSKLIFILHVFRWVGIMTTNKPTFRNHLGADTKG